MHLYTKVVNRFRKLAEQLCQLHPPLVDRLADDVPLDTGMPDALTTQKIDGWNDGR